MITFDKPDNVYMTMTDGNSEKTIKFDRANPQKMEEMLELILGHVMQTDCPLTFVVSPEEAE